MRMFAEGTLAGHVLASTRRVMVGFIAAAFIAIPLGIFLGTSARARAVFDPILSFLRPLPSMSASWCAATIPTSASNPPNARWRC